jgi:protein TonB
MKKALVLIILFCCLIILSCAASKQQTQPTQQTQSSDFVPVDKPPVLIKRAAPEYPEEARQQGITGTVWVKALIDKSGKVAEVVVVDDSSENVSYFKDSAIKAAYHDKWEPSKSKEGKPLAAWVTFRIDYKLK